jgi:hypothetical protein
LAVEETDAGRGWVAEAIIAIQESINDLDVTKTDLLFGVVVCGAVGLVFWNLPAIMKVRNERFEIMKAHERELYKLKTAHERMLERDKSKTGRK